ncbi:hypothetical protein MTO96_031688 [Rhipicephalus appendiculatus]
MGVKHYGMLNLLPHNTDLGARFHEVLLILKLIVQHVQNDYRDAYAVLGMHYIPHNSNIRVEYFRVIFRPTHFIAITYLSVPDGLGECHLVYPRSMMTYSHDLPYRHEYVGLP